LDRIERYARDTLFALADIAPLQFTATSAVKAVKGGARQRLLRGSTPDIQNIIRIPEHLQKLMIGFGCSADVSVLDNHNGHSNHKHDHKQNDDDPSVRGEALEENSEVAV